MAGHYPKLGVGSVSGPATITSAQMIDPYVPVDGTMNVTGAIAASTAITAGSALTLTAGVVIVPNTSANVVQVAANPTVGITMATTIYKLAPAATKPVIVGTSGSKEAVASGNRGSIFYEAGAGGVTDSVYLGVKDAADAYAWQKIVGGSGIQGSAGLAVGGVTAIKTTDYVATAADFLVPVDVNTTGDVAITLPAASAAKGQILHIKATATHATRDININRAGADTITTYAAAGATTVQLSPASTLSQLSLVSDGTSIWYITNHQI